MFAHSIAVGIIYGPITRREDFDGRWLHWHANRFQCN